MKQWSQREKEESEVNTMNVSYWCFESSQTPSHKEFQEKATEAHTLELHKV